MLRNLAVTAFYLATADITHSIVTGESKICGVNKPENPLNPDDFADFYTDITANPCSESFVDTVAVTTPDACTATDLQSRKIKFQPPQATRFKIKSFAIKVGNADNCSATDIEIASFQGELQGDCTIKDPTTVLKYTAGTTRVDENDSTLIHVDLDEPLEFTYTDNQASVLEIRTKTQCKLVAGGDASLDLEFIPDKGTSSTTPPPTSSTSEQSTQPSSSTTPHSTSTDHSSTSTGQAPDDSSSTDGQDPSTPTENDGDSESSSPAYTLTLLSFFVLQVSLV